MKKYILLVSLLLLQAPCFAAQQTSLDFNELGKTLQQLSREELIEFAQSFEEEKSAEYGRLIMHAVLAILLGMFTINLCSRVHNTICGNDTTPCFQPDGLLHYFPKILNVMCNKQPPIKISPILERIFS